MRDKERHLDAILWELDFRLYNVPSKILNLMTKVFYQKEFRIVYGRLKQIRPNLSDDELPQRTYNHIIGQSPFYVKSLESAVKR